MMRENYSEKAELMIKSTVEATTRRDAQSAVAMSFGFVYNEVSKIFDERQRRYLASMFAIALGHGGVSLMSEATRLSRSTIQSGISEIHSGGLEDYTNTKRKRKPGGGRPPSKPDESKNGIDGENQDSESEFADSPSNIIT